MNNEKRFIEAYEQGLIRQALERRFDTNLGDKMMDGLNTLIEKARSYDKQNRKAGHDVS